MIGGLAMFYAPPRSWSCRACGGIGTSPAHRMDCQYFGAGQLATSVTVRAARLELATAEAAAKNPATTVMSRDLVALVRRLLVAIDLAAIGEVQF